MVPHTSGLKDRQPSCLNMRCFSQIPHCSYSPEELRRCLRKEDIWNYKVDTSRLEESARTISEQFYDSGAAVDRLAVSQVHGNQVFRTTGLYDALCLRRTDQVLRKSLETKILSRDAEVHQLLQILKTEPTCKVFRTDIRRFFESIPLDDVIAELSASGFRSNATLAHLQAVATYLTNHHSYRGLPRGLAISSTLADYALRHFDAAILTDESVLYYSRYVDDICIIHFASPQTFEDLVKAKLPFRLELNAKKTFHLEQPSTNRLEFLGYDIGLSKPQQIKISSKKLARAKKRVVLTLRQYLVDRNFELLKDRLRFLTAAVEMAMVRREMPVYAGYRHVYRLCDGDQLVAQLQALDTFYQRILGSRRFYLARKLRESMTPEQGRELKKLSFAAAYKHRITYRITMNRMAQIKKAWKYA